MNSDYKNQYFPSIKQAFGIILKLILISIPVSIPFALAGMYLKHIGIDSSLIDNITTLLIYAILFGIVAKIGFDQFRKTNHSDYRFKFKKVPLRIFAISLAILIAGLFVTDPLNMLIPMPDSVRDSFMKFLQPNIFSFLTSVIAAPILEEILFRGIILEGFLRNYSPRKAVIWSSVIFGIAHLNPWQAVGAILIGILIGWIYMKTNSLIPGMILHFANNLIAFILMMTVDNKIDSFYALINNWQLFGILFLLALFVLIGGVHLLDRIFEKDFPSTNDNQI